MTPTSDLPLIAKPPRLPRISSQRCVISERPLYRAYRMQRRTTDDPTGSQAPRIEKSPARAAGRQISTELVS